MNQNITSLIEQIRRDIIQYTDIWHIRATPLQIEEIVREVVRIAAIDIGEDKYFYGDIAEAVKNVLD